MRWRTLTRGYPVTPMRMPNVAREMYCTANIGVMDIVGRVPSKTISIALSLRGTHLLIRWPEQQAAADDIGAVAMMLLMGTYAKSPGS